MSSNIAMSLRTKKYFDELSSKTNILYDIATRAKLNAKEPEVETHPASDIAARVEGLVGPKGIANAIRRIKEEKMSREEIAFKISEEIVLGRFGAFEEEKGADIAIRAALSLLTEGLTAAPQEGISKVKIKKNPDGSRYLAIYFAGPIRAAGGTETAIAVLIGDYIRQRLHLNRYLPKAEEVERVVEEIALYSRVGHVQIPVPPEDIKFAAERLPVEVTGEPTEQVEVSGHRDLERVETNRVRGGACLVINDGIVGRAHKITNLIEKVGLTGWDWLKELAEKRKGAKVNGNEKEGEETTEIKPVEKYLEDVIVGRPIFCHPSKIGGFRLRYGRSRNTGLSAVGLNPATMIILEDFLAPGTHIVTERPGKGAIVMPVDTIEGPIVKLNDGTVVEIKDEKEAIILVNSVEEILFLGDILVGFGEFLENNHPLMPSSFTKEIWCSELQETITKLFQNDIEKAVQEIEIEKEKLIQFIKDPLKTKPDPVESLKISLKLKIPLHPSYTYFWNNLTEKDVFMLRQWIIENKKQFSKDFITKIEGPFSQKIKNILENLMIPHKNENSTIILEEHAPTLSATLGISKNIDTKIDLIDQTQNSSLSIVKHLASFPIKDKFSGIYIGARMGRPEKAKKRTMSPPVHGLFPVGMAGGKTRNIIDASKKRKIWIEIVRKECECGHTTYKINCPKCGKKPRIRNTCINCGTVSDATICPKCGGESRPYSKQKTNLEEELENLRKKIGGLPSLVKGVQGLLSETKTPEPLIKGILRAKHDIYVFKDGTVRFDATDAPLTHFKPKEIKVSIDKLKELDYTHDIHGNPLKNDEQILELKVQDAVISEEGAPYLLKTANFIDTLLQKYYNMLPFYNAKKIEELIGHLVIGLAPHTSAGIIGRIIGFTKAKVTFAHPYWHAAKRRNCLIGREEVLLIDSMNRLVIRRIGDLEDEDLNQFRAISVDKKGEIVAKKIRELVKLPAPKHLYRIRTSTGREIIATPDHKMVVFKEDGVEFVEMQALQLGDKLLSLANLPTFDTSTNIDLIDYFLKQPNYEDLRIHGAKEILAAAIMKSGGYAAVMQKLNLKLTGKSLWGYIHKNSVPLDVFHLITERLKLDIDYSSLRISYRKNAATLPVLLPLSKKLGELSGLYLSDGFSRTDWKPGKSKYFYQVSWAISEKDVVDRVMEFCKTLFNRNPSIIKNDDHPYIITLSGKMYYELFRNILGLGNGAHEKSAAKCSSFSKEFQKGLLGGVLYGDGNIDKSVTLTSVNRELINHLALISLNLDLYPHLHNSIRTTNLSKDPVKFYNIRYYSTDLPKLSEFLFGVQKDQLLERLASQLLGQKHQSRFGCFNIVKIKELERIIEHGEDFVYDFVLESDEKTFIAGFGALATYDCDGDEDSIILALDAFLNFSKSYLPSTRGGLMDAPLVVTITLNPEEVDDESHKVDAGKTYPPEFYKLCKKMINPKKAAKIIDILEHRLGTAAQFEGIYYTHETSNIASGPQSSAYKKLKSMPEKLQAQLRIAKKVKAVDLEDVAERIINHHLLPDLLGCMRAFGTQSFRCVNCNQKYRRIPLKGKCLKCGGKLLLTVSRKTVMKYFNLAKELVKKYNLQPYLQQRLELFEDAANTLFETENKNQRSLSDFSNLNENKKEE
ncbi:MAG: DNA polymerase II large subunit [Candidatus Wukongarchaeota archaeon]|nr:DNA polymerase II large subunit [Candidatus Wukongarchaeota archaeon]